MATVQMNYHIQVDKMNYSVPYEYVGKRVEVKCSDSNIDIYFKGNHICQHTRLYGRRNQYSTNEAHMPENHQLFQWNADRFRRWAEQIGPNTFEVIDKHIKCYKTEEQAYKGCLSILKLSDKYTSVRLENACQLALEHIPNPIYKNIRLILESGQDIAEESRISDRKEDLTHAIVRGKDYYGGRH